MGTKSGAETSKVADPYANPIDQVDPEPEPVVVNPVAKAVSPVYPV